MALQFQTDIQTRDGFTIQNAYGRVGADDRFTGTDIAGHVDIYASEQAYLDGARFVVTRLIQSVEVPYDRNIDGTDILNIAHDGLISVLADQGIVATKEL